MILCNILEISKAPSYAEIMQQVYPNHRRGELMGKVRVATSISTIVTATIIGQLLQVMDFRWVYAGAGLLGVASILVFTQIHCKDTPNNRPPTSLKKMLLIPRSDKRYGAFLASTFLLGFANWMALSIYPIIVVDELHVTNSFYGILAATTSGLSIIFYFVWGAFSDRHHSIVLTYIAFALSAVNIAVYLISWDPLFLLVPAAISGISNAAGDLSTINSAIQFPKDPQDIPHYMALYTSLIGVRGIIAPFLVSFLLIFISPRWTLALSFIIMVVGLINFYVVMRRLLRDPEFVGS
jgi:dipeptide/tripeptide permease